MNAISREPGSSRVRCERHPERAVLGACARCGTFICQEDRRLVNGVDYCETCAARPEVDSLETMRRKYWGRRDGWAWFFLLGALAWFVFLRQRSGTHEPPGLPATLLSLSGIVLGLCYWLGLPFARWGPCLLALAHLGFTVIQRNAGGVMLGLVPLTVSLTLLVDTRSRLFFQQPVSDEALGLLWRRHVGNPLARTGFLLSLVGVLVVPVAPFALVFSLLALARVSPTAVPPIGGRNKAVAGIVCAAGSLLAWTILLGPRD
ncbi:B-box zinc finger protein [Melittangium boletus]|uniref:B-box zinc finger protein n=1 Tax=Melittangium boletus TaxID=83453 RepID=UPI003DA6AD03